MPNENVMGGVSEGVEREEGVKEPELEGSAFETWIRSMLPPWLQERSTHGGAGTKADELVAAIKKHGSLARLMFELGRKYELQRTRELVARLEGRLEELRTEASRA